MLISAFCLSWQLFMQPFLSQVCGDLVGLNTMYRENLVSHIGIEVTTVGPAFISGKMPVDDRTRQPHGILHGGASIALAETLGSTASFLLVSGTEGARVAGIEVSGSHVRAVGSGYVYGLCRPVHVGRTLHFWHVDIRDESGLLACTAKLTVSISSPSPDVVKSQAG
jgi:1,4-dihydroxy-2-naphthoyl-CoA hydrolase